MSFKKIVITGGPCAGKTSSLFPIVNELDKRGYRTLIVLEVATELIEDGITEQSLGSRKRFQKEILKRQIEHENEADFVAAGFSGDKNVIICDRGCLDCKSYLSDEDFKDIAESVGLSEVLLRDRYDGVFHLNTAAKGTGYNLKSNKARSETPEEAICLDDRLISSWTGTPHLRIIDTTEDSKEKTEKLISEILEFLGEEGSFEIERKFLINYPDLDMLNSLSNCEKVEITQTYLKTSSGEERRVRQRGLDGEYVYFYTEKKDVSKEKRIEGEKRITKEEYDNLLLHKDDSLNPVIKDRYCLMYNNQYFEIDVYPFWNDKAILEIELHNEDEKINFPDFIEIVREVTGEKEYKNSNLAKFRGVKQ